MKSISSLFIFFLIAGLFLASCSREDIDEIVVEEPEYTPDTMVVNNLMSNLKSNSSDGMDLGCVTIQFPFELLTESGATLSINSEDEFLDAIEMDTDLVVDFVYPITVTDSDGLTTQINDVNDLGIIFASCIPETGWTGTGTATGNDLLPACLFEDFCFEIVFPVELEDIEGNEYTAEDEDEFIDLFATVGPLFFTLPVTFEDEDGNIILVDDIDSFFELVFECEEITPPSAGDGIQVEGFGCLELVYPYDVELEDGTVVTINDEDEYATLVLNGEIAYLVFPYSLEDPNGDIIEVNNIDDLIEAFISCGIFIEITESDACEFTPAHILLFYNALNIFTLNNYEYDINFPVTLIVEGNPIVVNNGDEYLPAVGGSPSNILPAEIVYPVTVTQFGQDIVLNSDDDVCDFYESLSEPCENKPAHIQFFFNGGPGTPIDCAYFIDYPLEIARNGSNIEVQSREDYLDELNTPNGYDEIELVYPVRVIQFNSNQQIDFTSDDDICEYLDDCF